MDDYLPLLVDLLWLLPAVIPAIGIAWYVTRTPAAAEPFDLQATIQRIDAHGSARRILVADDSLTIQKVMELTFMDQDIHLICVSDGQSATRVLNQRRFDLLVADVHMPGVSGYEVCSHSKKLYPDVPVLLMVGTFEDFDERLAREAGADQFIKKPFDSQEMLTAVGVLMSGGQSGEFDS